jgi:hypothetical protein
MDSREFSEWQCYFEVLDEKMKEQKKEEQGKEAAKMDMVSYMKGTGKLSDKTKKKK